MDWTLISIIGGLALLLLILFLYMGWNSGSKCKEEKKTIVYSRHVPPQVVYPQQHYQPQVEVTTTNLKSINIPTRGNRGITSPSLVSLDASLNVPDLGDIGGLPPINGISFSENITTLPRIPPASLTSTGHVSLASAQTLSIPSFQDLPGQVEIQGF